MYELQYDCLIHHIAEKRYHTFCGGIPKIFFQVLWHIAIGGIHTHRVSGAEIVAQR